ncbi:MAG: heterodisulfide reductase-related iron-sulfur binding cluster [Planctomycetota bacterium]|nr:heterodisulfide reductase-related iron-sulfur binding cluster [Planctomycetota bacterium]
MNKALPSPLTREVLGNIDSFSRGLFYGLALIATLSFCWGVWRRVRLWRLGQASATGVSWPVMARRFCSDVLCQRLLRRDRRGAGRAHTLLFAGFCLLLIGTILVGIEHYGAALSGAPAGNPLFHQGLYYAVYEVTLDTAGLFLLAGCGWFAWRRWRADSSIDHHWTDSCVLASLILLGVTGYLVEGARILHEQTPQPGVSYVGLAVARVLQSLGVDGGLAARLHFQLWWLHAVLALGWIAAFPYTRLLHVLVGSFQLVTRNHQPGTLRPISLTEVETRGYIGAAQLTDLTQRQLLELDACISCGRCQDSCPAHQAGQPLSPRAVVQSLRGQLNDLQPSDGTTPPLRSDDDRTGSAALWSCTTCGACSQICPLGVDPLGLILPLRQYQVGEGNLRGGPAMALQKMQRSGNPWGLPIAERMDWAAGLDVPTVTDNPNFKVLYWVGCAAAYDRAARSVARAVVQLLRAAKVSFAVLGSAERCTGESARRIGEELLFQELAEQNQTTLQQHRVRQIVTHCPHCLNSLRKDYPQFGDAFDVVHHTQFLLQLVEQGQLPSPRPRAGHLTYHDPCYLARVNAIRDAPRALLAHAQGTAAGAQLTELPRHGTNTACCGAGGGRMWMDDLSEQRIGSGRIDEIIDSEADTVAVACPFCRIMVKDGLAGRQVDVGVRDVAEILLESLQTED